MTPGPGGVLSSSYRSPDFFYRFLFLVGEFYCKEDKNEGGDSRGGEIQRFCFVLL